MGGSKSKLSGPSHAFLGSDGRPYYEPDPDEERSRCCCIYVARGVLKLIIAVLLLGIIGLDAAALIAGPKQYFTYYTNKSPEPNELRQFKTGWLRWSNTELPGVTFDLKQLSKALWIMGIVSGAYSIATALLAVWLSVSVIFKQTGRRTCWCTLPIGLIQIGCLVAYYVLAAVAVSQQNGSVIRSRNAPWPSWAWAFLAGAGLVWVVVSILMLAIPAPTVYVPNEYLQNEAAAARGWNRADQAPAYPPEHEASRMGVNAPSSAPVQMEEPRLSYTVKKPADTSNKGGFFSRGNSNKQPYRSRTDEIAQRYRGGGSADIELPSTQPRKAWD